MSYPSGFSRLRSGDGGTEGMARGEDNIGSHEGDGLPSTSSEDVPSRVDSVRVIMWLKPIREPWAGAFWKKFSFPPNVRVSLMSSRFCVDVCTDKDHGDMNFIF